jgi:trk system potassium uptake protein TrkH
MGQLITIILMFIGGSPTSIAGGVKTTTIFLLFVFLFKKSNQNGVIVYGGRKFTSNMIFKAVKIIMYSLLIVVIATMMILMIEGNAVTIESVVYEVVSAICTVGLSFGITPTLSVMSKLTLILLMYIGRIGMITIPLAFKFKETSSSIEYVSAKIIVG